MGPTPQANDTGMHLSKTGALTANIIICMYDWLTALMWEAPQELS